VATTLRNIRVAEPLWSAARAVAEAREETVSDVLRAALERYVARNRQVIEPARPEAPTEQP